MVIFLQIKYKRKKDENIDSGFLINEIAIFRFLGGAMLKIGAKLLIFMVISVSNVFYAFSQDCNAFLAEGISFNETEKTNLMTDSYGVLSYTHDLSGSLNRALSLLKTDGTLYIQNGFRKNTVIKKESRFGTLTYGIGEYLASVPGLIVEFISEDFEDRETPIIKVTKTEYFQEGSIPHLILQSMKDSFVPPQRSFLWSEKN